MIQFFKRIKNRAKNRFVMKKNGYICSAEWMSGKERAKAEKLSEKMLNQELEDISSRWIEGKISDKQKNILRLHAWSRSHRRSIAMPGSDASKSIAQRMIIHNNERILSEE